jgi:phage terminase large subunit-like protein
MESYGIVIATGIVAGIINRWLLLRSDYRHYPTYPHGQLIHLALGFIAASLGAVAVPAIAKPDYVAVTFLVLAAQQFREVRNMERETLMKLEESKIISRGTAYIEGIARVFEARNYLVIMTALATSAAVYKPLGSFYQVLSAEAYTKHGLNVHGVVFDELHAQPNRDLYDVMLHGSGDARKQPLFFLITTAGTDRNSICWEVHQKAEDILQGRKIDPTFYPVIYSAADTDDWTSEKVWRKVNPSLGITVDIEKLRVACENAKQNPAEENLFRQLRLNQWVKQSVRWMPMDKWDKCAFPVDAEKLRGRTCYGGLDLSSTTDITAFVLVFPPLDESDKYQILPFFWIPEENIDQRVRRDHVPYDVWERQGFLYTTEGNVVHYGFIETFIEELGMKYNIKEIAFDRWGAIQMTQNLEALGFTVIPFGQGFKDMSPPTKELMKLTLEERIAHGGNPVLRWMMDNIYVKTDPAGNIKPDKEKSTERIDGAVALIMALDRALRHDGDERNGSIYDERGLLIL